MSGPRRLTIKQLVVGTFQILGRTWPFILASAAVYVLAVGALTLVLYLMMTAISNSFSSADSFDDMGSVMTTILTVLVVGWFVMIVVNGVLDAPWIGIVAVATDVTIRAARRPAAREVAGLIRRRFVPLATVFVIMLLVVGFLPIVAGLLLMNMPSVMLMSEGTLVLLGLLYIVVIVSIVIVMEFAPWAVLFEGKGVIAAFARSATLARKAVLQLIALHLIWAFVGAPLMMIGMELPSVLGGILLFAAGLFVAMCYLTCQGLVYADIRAVEQGHSLVLRFATPPIPVARAWAEVRELVGAGTPAAGAAPVAPRPAPSRPGPAPQVASAPGASPASPFARPWPGAAFRPAPGWPSPPSGWAPPANWRPDPAWPPAPVDWRFWE
ncbi:hypothetical protein AXK61_02315 [Tsukamurella pseudospumae]|uniref:Glycerophosphoryl diester phosphodiesterase membrane domain-containing protein n=1 Tax=Tsukamurella pseudospumae TaxID=239498 RepID=A0A137ZJY7_9ACTN|nr:hypothetical protein AXK61_02315 [Tsukamurella pseudospumae]